MILSTMFLFALMTIAFGVLLFASITLLSLDVGDNATPTSAIAGGVFFGLAIICAVVAASLPDILRRLLWR